MRLRGLFLTGALAAAFALAGAGTAQARDTCRECIQREEFKLQREIRRHGWNSRQVRNRREKIYRLQRECGGRSYFGDRRRDDRRWDRDGRDRDDWRWRDRNRWYWDGRNWRRR